MSDKVKREEVLKQLKQSLLAKFGEYNVDLINYEIVKLLSKKKIDSNVSLN